MFSDLPKYQKKGIWLYIEKLTKLPKKLYFTQLYIKIYYISHEDQIPLNF